MPWLKVTHWCFLGTLFMPRVTDFVQDALEVQNTPLVALVCESHGGV